MKKTRSKKSRDTFPLKRGNSRDREKKLGWIKNNKSKRRELRSGGGASGRGGKRGGY
jgi:hypothetical protein